ncbi:hypothetical protein F2Q70_00007155 [Brassica cretica]|uniref:RRM domain-containing protein n=1 Tax=Brassica cretica TaxID=69181 RepID=A0A8S9LS78_BRACR|nr:hypothetical protein F2Q70_00007155 [Brassica cretica]
MAAIDGAKSQEDCKLKDMKPDLGEDNVEEVNEEKVFKASGLRSMYLQNCGMIYLRVNVIGAQDVEPSDRSQPPQAFVKLLSHLKNNFQRSRSEAISVTGYDPSLPQEDLKSALSKHFASCGEITDILILDSRALIHMYGLGSVQRAVRLHGTDLGGGFNLTVQEASDSD